MITPRMVLRLTRPIWVGAHVQRIRRQRALVEARISCGHEAARLFAEPVDLEALF